MEEKLKHSWRWYGPQDPVSLADSKQSGATSIVSALHHIPNGEVWSVEEIQKHQKLINKANMDWIVVESLPVHESIKHGQENIKLYLSNYQKSLINLAKCGIKTVCYNFMPILDWTRTDLSYKLADGSRTLKFDSTRFAAFDLFILKRKHAEKEYSVEEQKKSFEYFQKLNTKDIELLTYNILRGLPGAEETYNLRSFQNNLDRYKDIQQSDLRMNMLNFLNHIIPTAVDIGINMVAHPDDPPWSIFGLPRILSDQADMRWLRKAYDIENNGFCFCTGSYGSSQQNNLLSMLKENIKRVNFLHLRSVTKEKKNQTFYESSHIHGDVDMVQIVKIILEEENIRKQLGKPNAVIPMRPDHGHQILDDLKKSNNPGYSAIGRMKGLAELRGIEIALKSTFQL